MISKDYLTMDRFLDAKVQNLIKREQFTTDTHTCHSTDVASFLIWSTGKFPNYSTFMNKMILLSLAYPKVHRMHKTKHHQPT